MPIKLNSAGGGSVTINAASTAAATVLTVPATNANIVTTGDTGVITQAMMGTGVGSTGPSFSVTMSANQTVTGSTWTKIAFNTEAWDTNSCYDTTLYRFTPNVAGYYHINGYLWKSTGSNVLIINLYKNGSSLSIISPRIDFTSGAYGTNYGVGLNAMTYCNGTTDYLELWGYTNLTSWDSGYSYFSGFLARAA